MALLTHCFFCKRTLIIPSGEEAYELTDYDFEDLHLFDNYKKESPYVMIGKYCCKSCFDREILPKLFR